MTTAVGIAAVGIAAVITREVRTQFRSGLSALYLGMPLVWILIARLLPPGARPVVTLVGIYADPVMMGTIFTGAFLARERDQGLFGAWAVTPLGAGGWLAGRVFVIATQGMIGGTILVLGTGIHADFVLLIPALFLASACGALNGLLLARPFRDILSFFVAGGMASALICLPVAGGYIRPGWVWLFTGPAWPGWSALASALGLSPDGGDAGQGSATTAMAALAALAGWAIILFVLVRRIYHRGFFRRPGGGGE